MKRILQISIGSKVFGGVEKFLYEIYKKIDKQKIQFDFLSPNITSYGLYADEIKKMGGNIIELKIDRAGLKGKILYNKKLYEFLKSNEYDIVHINSGAFFFCLQVAFICKICKVKRIIVHSHNNIKMSNLKKTVKNLLKPMLNFLADDCLACSNSAANALFLHRKVKNGKVKIINNGIETDIFKFNEKIREEYRKNLNLEDKIVYGHVGRFDREKNHYFLIKVFNEICKVQKNAILMLIGEGKLENDVKKMVEELELNDKVYFLGVRKDVNNIMTAMDCFIFPSLYEGLGIVAIEAQTSRLNYFQF